jgi:hypothetical protein
MLHLHRSRPGLALVRPLVPAALAAAVVCTALACSDDGKQTSGCSNIPKYDIAARQADGGLDPLVEQAIDMTAQNGCVTNVGDAKKL